MFANDAAHVCGPNIKIHSVGARESNNFLDHFDVNLRSHTQRLYKGFRTMSLVTAQFSTQKINSDFFLSENCISAPAPRPGFGFLRMI